MGYVDNIIVYQFKDGRMKIGKQNNANDGDVFNIETFHNAPPQEHCDLPQHFKEVKKIPKISVANKDFMTFLGGVAVVIGLIVDITELLDWFGMPWWGWLLLIVTAMVMRNHFFMDEVKISYTDEVQIGEYNSLIVPTESSFVIYESQAPCIYPNCNGTIRPVAVPDNYNGPYTIFGQCSRAGLQHGYVIDKNLQAYPAEIYSEYRERARSE